MEETSDAPFNTTGTWKVAPEAGGVGGGLSAKAAPEAGGDATGAGAEFVAAEVVAGGCTDTAGGTEGGAAGGVN